MEWRGGVRGGVGGGPISLRLGGRWEGNWLFRHTHFKGTHAQHIQGILHQYLHPLVHRHAPAHTHTHVVTLAVANGFATHRSAVVLMIRSMLLTV